jgi:hypothetical protein
MPPLPKRRRWRRLVAGASEIPGQRWPAVEAVGGQLHSVLSSAPRPAGRQSKIRARCHRGKNWDGFGNVLNPDEVGGVPPTVGETNLPSGSPKGTGFENTPVGKSVGCGAARGTGVCRFIVPCCASGRAAPDVVGSLAPSRRVSVTPPWVNVGPPGDMYLGPTVTVNVGNLAPI